MGPFRFWFYIYMPCSTFFCLGSPRCRGSINKIIETACQEAEIYRKHNIAGVIIENMHDNPYLKSNCFGPEITATMTKVCSEVRSVLPKTMACGVQVLAGGNKEALAVALSSGFNFIRAEGFVYAHVADEGYMDSCAGILLRYRNQIKADDILIFTDIKKKHSSHAITHDVSIEETAEAAEFFESDGVIITGTATGKEINVEDLEKVKITVNIPVIIGSGVTDENVHKYLSADALIVGSHFKRNGKWKNPIEEDRVVRFLDKYYSLMP